MFLYVLARAFGILLTYYRSKWRVCLVHTRTHTRTCTHTHSHAQRMARMKDDARGQHFSARAADRMRAVRRRQERKLFEAKWVVYQRSLVERAVTELVHVLSASQPVGRSVGQSVGRSASQPASQRASMRKLWCNLRASTARRGRHSRFCKAPCQCEAVVQFRFEMKAAADSTGCMPTTGVPPDAREGGHDRVEGRGGEEGEGPGTWPSAVTAVASSRQL